MAQLALFFVTLVALAATASASLIKKPVIVGGTEVTSDTQFPYMASVRDGFDWHICGGTIVNSRYLLTAGHCVSRELQVSVTVGSRFYASGTPYNIILIK